ncbi:MAG: DUF5076 domain-containing protein [Phycisphaerales bacterium]
MVKFDNKNELKVPPLAMKNPDAVEIIRVWIAKGKQEVCLKVGMWNDPAIWGCLLADVARHIANVYAHAQKVDFDEVLERILEGFNDELDKPVDDSGVTL